MLDRKKLDKEILEYCKLNGISDVELFTNQCLLNGFNIIRYGTSPKDNIERQNGKVVAENNVTNDDKKEKEQVIKKKRKIIVKNN